MSYLEDNNNSIEVESCYNDQGGQKTKLYIFNTIFKQKSYLQSLLSIYEVYIPTFTKQKPL